MERDEGCEYSLGTLYAYMKIEQWDLLQLF
jgi:hypothetical protein